MPSNVTYSSGSAGLIARALSATALTQKEFGELLGVHRRTVIRWLGGGTTLLPSQCQKIAIASYARDRELAADMAARAGTTLGELGLEKPPPPPLPPPAPPAPPPRPAPSSRHMVDSIVCAAAEAMQMTPQAARPGLLAAYERTCALGMSAEEVLQALALPVPVPAPAEKSKRKPPRA